MSDKVHMYTYSEKATEFCEILTLLLSYVVPVKSKVKISPNFVAFSEYMNFTNIDLKLPNPAEKTICVRWFPHRFL